MVGSSKGTRAALFLCAINLVAVLYFLQGFLSSKSDPGASFLILDADSPGAPGVPPAPRFTDREVLKIKEATEARQVLKPVDLIKMLNGLQLESEKAPVPNGEWGKGFRRTEWRGRNSYPGLSENPKLDGGKLVLDGPEVEDEIIPGRPLPEACNPAPHTDYDGVAVRWGLTHQRESAADCCQACLDQARTAKEGELKCNIWVFCPAEEGCFSPDIYEHKQFECWLKQADHPRVNFKGKYAPEFRQQHPSCPHVVPWASGVISA